MTQCGCNEIMKYNLWCACSWAKEAVRKEEQLEVDAQENDQNKLEVMVREERESDKDV